MHVSLPCAYYTA